MPYTRAWELALGGVIAFLPEIANKRFSNFRKLLPWIGIILIGAAVFQFRSPVDFTGNKVVASVLGAFLLIYAIQPTSLLYRILASRPLVFVGKISYSIYLFHLPMIVLWKHYAGTSIIPHGYGLLFIITTIFTTLPAGSMELEGSIPHVFRQRTGNCLSVRDRSQPGRLIRWT
jgi:peptidoglycan/LPS O-acetylase OafA/YrhL